MSTEKSTSEQVDRTPSNDKDSGIQAIPECFVIMPISDPEGYAAGHFRRVYEDLFVPACDRAGYKAIRADEVRQTNLIHLDVLQKIIDSPMAVCDLSNRNPNVMFELGLRQAFDKPVVLVQERGTPPVFDITPLRYTEYSKDMLYRQVIEDQESITAAIAATRDAIGSEKSVNSIVKLLSLTHSAVLASFSEEDKESAVLQVIMSELGNLRNEIRNISQVKEFPQSQMSASVISKKKFKESLRSLDREIRRFTTELSEFFQGKGEDDDFDIKIDFYSIDVKALMESAKIAGTDEDMEHLTLLDAQMKVLKNRYNRHLQREASKKSESQNK